MNLPYPLNLYSRVQSHDPSRFSEGSEKTGSTLIENFKIDDILWYQLFTVIINYH
jgi:hypothetical protein